MIIKGKIWKESDELLKNSPLIQYTKAENGPVLSIVSK